MSEQFPGTSTVGEGESYFFMPTSVLENLGVQAQTHPPKCPMLGHGIALSYQGPGYSTENLSRVFPLSL